MSDEPVNASDAQKTALQEWLKRHGYPLEMRVARTFREEGCLNVGQSDYFEDTDDSGAAVWREIDVVGQFAVYFHRNDPVHHGEKVNLLLDVLGVAECKHNAQGNRPWIVFSNRADYHENSAPDLALAHPTTRLANRFIRHLHANAETRQLVRDLPLFAPRPLGYAAKCAILPDVSRNKPQNQGGGGGPADNYDTAYNAISKVLRAARPSTTQTSTYHHAFRFVVPIVVTTAPIYECYLGADSESQLEERDQMTLLWKNPAVGLSDAVVRIVREPALPGVLRAIKTTFDVLSRCEDVLMAAYVSEEHQRRARANATSTFDRVRSSRKRTRKPQSKQT